VHGLEMRTELHFGAAAEELHKQLGEAADQMLILGISSLEQLREEFAALFSSSVSYSLMLVYRPAKEGEAGAREAKREVERTNERAAL
jgi:sulfate/thiosulfate transport system ATP-binding protein